MRDILKKFKNRKVLAAAAIIILGGSYVGYGFVKGTSDDTRYALAKVTRGTLVTSITATGQVSAYNQLDIKPKASGDIIYVGVKNGQEVKTEILIAQLDAREAQKAIRDAEANLESAKLSLEKLKKPADALSILQAENALFQAKESKQKAEDNLKKTYEDGFNAIANAFLDLPGIMAGLEDTLFDSTIDRSSYNITWYANQTEYQNNERDKAIRYRDEVNAAYNNARKVYTKNFDDYKNSSRASDTETIESLISQTYDTIKVIADTVKTADNYIDFVQDAMEQRDLQIPSMVLTHQSNLSSYTKTTNDHLLNLLSVKRTIEDSKEAIVNADRSIAEKTESFAKLKAGPDALDIKSAELIVKQRENALSDAKEKLADYFIRVPFDGTAASVNVKRGDSVSASTVIATLVTKQKLATIALNEVDVAKIKIGQKATLAFDAIPDLTISGQVAQIDTIGAVTQGVVNYSAKISFDTQDERIKPGMSASVAIITDIRQDVLLAPNGAIKSRADSSYVEMFDSSVASRQSAMGNTLEIASKTSPKAQTVEIGLANDSDTEILSGLNEGDWIVTRTLSLVSASAAPASSQQRSGGLGIPGLGGSSTRMGGMGR